MTKANEGHGIEVLHMAYVLQDMLDNYVRETVWVHDNPDLQASVDKAADALAQMYQDIGNSIPD